MEVFLWPVDPQFVAVLVQLQSRRGYFEVSEEEGSQ
jgi:hypothetical protein